MQDKQPDITDVTGHQRTSACPQFFWEALDLPIPPVTLALSSFPSAVPLEIPQELLLEGWLEGCLPQQMQCFCPSFCFFQIPCNEEDREIKQI